MFINDLPFDDEEDDVENPLLEEGDDEEALDLLDDSEDDGEEDKKKPADKKPADKSEDGEDADEDEDGVGADAKNKNRFEKRLKREVYMRRESERQRDEALRYAKQVLEDRRKDRQIAHIATKAFAEESASSIDAAMAGAEAEYRKAYEDADADALIKAQKRMAELAVKKEKASDRVERLKNIPDPVEDTPAFEAPRRGPDEKTIIWQEKNQWYGKDDIMTAAAWTIHQRLAQKGIYGNTDVYWTLLDKGMRESFPHKFEQKKAASSTSVVAGVSRRSATGTQRSLQLTDSQKAVAKRLGLTNQQYLEELKKMES
jgi:hypothetical protein